MTLSGIHSFTSRNKLLVFAFAILAAGFLAHGSASADYSALPQYLPEDQYQFINLTESSNPADYSGYGADLPTSVLKVYSQNGASRTISINIYNRRAGDALACSGMGIVANTITLDSQENINGVVPGQEFPVTACVGQPGYTTMYFTMPASAFVQSTKQGHAGLFVALLWLQIDAYGGNTATLRVGTDAGGKLDYEGGEPVTIYPSLANPAGTNVVAMRFQTPCDFAEGGLTELQWDDVDYDGTNSNIAQPFDPTLLALEYNYDGTPAGAGGTGFIQLYDSSGNPINHPIWGGSGSTYAWAKLRAGYKYSFQFQRVANGNGIELHYPFDAGDWYIGTNCTTNKLPGNPPAVGITAARCGDKVYGWAYDPDNPNWHPTVRLYFKDVGAVATNRISPDLIANDVNPGGTPANVPPDHGFSWTITSNLENGNDYAFTADVFDDGLGTPPGSPSIVNSGDFIMSGCIGYKIIPTVTFHQLQDASGQNEENPTKYVATTNFSLSVPGWTGATPPQVSANYENNVYKNGLLISSSPSGSDVYGSHSYSVNVPTGATSPGFKFCVTARVTRNAEGVIDKNGNFLYATNNTASSDPPPTCDVVVAKPYFKVYGGDISVGNGFDSYPPCDNTTSNIMGWGHSSGGIYFGSGTQFAAYITSTSGTLNGFASAQSYQTGVPNFVSAPKDLSFANNGGAVNVGGGVYGSSMGGATCIGTLTPPLNAQTWNVTGNPSDFNQADSTNIYSVTPVGGTLTFTGGTLGLGADATLYVNGNVYITSDITAQTGATSVDKIPNFTLVATGNIYIDKNVHYLYGNYIAQPTGPGSRGGFYTCSDGAGSYNGGNLSYVQANSGNTLFNDCNSRLFIYGTVTARKLYLLRTAGSQYKDSGGVVTDAPVVPGGAGGANNAAEVFLYNPLFWIHQANTNGLTNDGDVRYDAVTTLPPIL